MFERAVRMKLRFKSAAGQLTPEDLYDLPLKSTTTTNASLNDVAKAINKELSQDNEESFVEELTPKASDNELRLEIVKHVIKVRLEENQARLDRSEIKEQNQKILGIIANKEDQKLGNMSVPALKKMIK